MGGLNITNTWAHEQKDRSTKTVIGTREARDHRDQGNRPVIRKARGRQNHRTSHEQDRTLGRRLHAFSCTRLRTHRGRQLLVRPHAN